MPRLCVPTFLLAVAFSLQGCSNQLELTRLEHKNLKTIEENVNQLARKASAGQLNAGDYDMHALVGESVLNEALALFNGYGFVTEASGREIAIEIDSISIEFRAGTAVARLDATATDPRSGLVAGLKMDGAFSVSRVEGDKLQMFVNATRVVPDLSWSGVSLSRWRFVRDLLLRLV